MSHWFHRNPLKATAKVSFELGLVAGNTAARQVCNDAAVKRNKLLEMLCDPNLDIEPMKEAYTQYLCLLVGFITEPEGCVAQSKIRHAIKFRWTNSLSLKGDSPLEQFDSVFEFINMMTNVAIWFTKHAAKISSKESVSMEEAKEIHTSLRIAAGIFKELRDHYVLHLLGNTPPASDVDDRVLEAYFHQCTAEAQEVTMGRAIEMKHAATVIASLAFETSKTFKASELALATLEDKHVLKWRRYLQFKSLCYRAYAYNYKGEMCLDEDKGGDAIASLREALKCCVQAEQLANDYCKTPGPGNVIKPQQHLFFRRLQPHIQRTMDKCQRENSLIYHQKVPGDIPDLELRASYGLVNPEPLPVPEIHALWKEAYKGLDITKLLPGQTAAGIAEAAASTSSGLANNKSGGDKGKEEPIQPLKEKPIYESEKDPQNHSGCIVS